VKVAVSYVVFALAVLSAAGAARAQDSAADKAAFSKCQACHSVDSGAKNKPAPELDGLDGRKAGAAAGYRYSPALKNAGFAWDQASFAAFMQNSRAKVPGNRMAFAGMKDQTERRRYLQVTILQTHRGRDPDALNCNRVT
jgi:cytochrome c